ncbi:hypothetical protein Tco_1314240 [Tanacetum coccineum]
MNLKQVEVTKAKSSIEEPLELELKDLPSHLEYDYLEGIDKLPVIIAKGLKDDEKEALLKVLKSHKWAIAWKITDINGYELPPSLVHFLYQTFQSFQRHASHTKLLDQEVKSISWHRFGEDVSQLVLSPDKL